MSSPSKKYNRLSFDKRASYSDEGVRKFSELGGLAYRCVKCNKFWSSSNGQKIEGIFYCPRCGRF